jgi:hypothetical protein
MHPVVFLGPQRFSPTLVEALDRIGVEGRLAAITAGWQEREQEIDELEDHVGRDVVNLRLWERADELLTADPELAVALRARQRSLKTLQVLYRIRLKHTLEAAREVMRSDGRERFVREHRQAAIRAIRTLDRQHLRRVTRIHEAFVEEWRPLTRPSVATHREQFEQIIEDAAAVVIAGGHVAVLVNRMRLFGFDDLLPRRPVVAWSAGAMALTSRIVLFHDSPPQGAGDAEVLDTGLNTVHGIVALPSASRRLNLEDPVRVALMARRFSPDLTALLDPGAEFLWRGDGWEAVAQARRLSRRGALVDA